MGYRDYSTAKGHIVDATGHGDFTTISAAITASSSGQTIFIRPGTYTENLALKAGVNITAFGSDGNDGQVTIVGKCSLSSAGSVSISGVQLNTNGDYVVEVTGTLASGVFLDACFVNLVDHAAFNLTSSSALSGITFSNSIYTGGAFNLFAHSGAGTISIQEVNSQATPSSTANTVSGSGLVDVYWSTIQSPITTSSTSSLAIKWSYIQPATEPAITLGASGGISIIWHSTIIGQIIVNNTSEILHTTINSSQTNAISGSGTLKYNKLTFSGTSTQVLNTLTLTLEGSEPSNATSGYVLTSTGANKSPTWQAVGASGAIATITGNDSVAESPSAGNFNIIGSGSITTTGSAATETITLTGLTNHAVLVGAGTATITKVAATANTGAVLQNNSGADPSYSTATYPSTTTINQILYSSSANTVAGLSTTNRAVLTTSATGVPALTALATDGQLIIGSTAGAPAAATLSAGAGISITNGSNSITIAATGAGFTWSDKAISFNAVAENGYNITANATATLPASPNDGDTIKFFIDGAVTLTIQANTGQTIQFASNISSSAGTQVNTATGDAATIHYRASDTKWCADSFVGAWNKT